MRPSFIEKLKTKLREDDTFRSAFIAGVSFIVGIASLATFLPVVLSRINQNEWVPASEIVSPSLLDRILEQNTTTPIEAEQVRAMSLDGVLLIDFNHPSLCGRMGCLYTAYSKEGDRLLNLVLQPQPNLFTINKTDSSRLCLDIKQPQSGQTLIYTYCHEDGQFIQVITSATD